MARGAAWKASHRTRVAQAPRGGFPCGSPHGPLPNRQNGSTMRALHLHRYAPLLLCLAAFGAHADWKPDQGFLEFGTSAHDSRALTAGAIWRGDWRREALGSEVTGSVEAFVGTEPYPSVAAYNKLGRTLISFEKYDMVPVILAVNLKTMHERGDDLVNFMRGWMSATRVFEKDMPRAANIVWKVFQARGYKLPESVIQSAVEKLGADYQYRPGLEKYLDEQAKELLRLGKIRKLPDWSTALDHTIVQRAMKT